MISSPADLQRLMQAPYAVSDQQWAAISAPLRPCVVIAGAGSGKTTLMAARVVYLVATGQVRPDQVLGLTFTTKAAAELRVRIGDALTRAGLATRDDEDELLEPQVATYNAYASRLIREHGLRLGHEPDTRLLTDASRYLLGARAVDRYRGDVVRLSDHPPTVIQNLLALDASMTEHLVDADAVRYVDAQARKQFESELAREQAGKARKTYLDAIAGAIDVIDRRSELLGLVAGYRRLKSDLGLMDFADQIQLSAQLATEHSEVGALERERFPVVLLDEYQDTSVAQVQMLAGLFSGATKADGRGHAVMAVGDPHQAIYGWRGAAASNIVSFPQAFPALDGETSVLPLTVNRRSTKRILEVANRLADPLYAKSEAVLPLEPADDAGVGSVEAHVFETQREELAWVADEVAALGSDDEKWSEIAVLTRDNASAEACFDALAARGVPVEIVGLAGLLRLPEIAEVVATLTLLHDVTANAAMLTLLTGPRWAIGPRDLRLLAKRAIEVTGAADDRDVDGEAAAQLAAIADGVDPIELPALYDALEDPGEGAYSAEASERFAALAAELRWLRSHAGEPLLDVVRRVIDASGVEIELASAISPAAAARRDNLDVFVRAVADFQAVDGDVTLPALLAYLTAEDEQGNGLDLATPSEVNSVKLLTIHRSKGLEWRTVFVTGISRTKFPSNRSRSLWTSAPFVLPAALRGDAADLPSLAGHDKAALDAYREATRAHDRDEELRLAYVAVTRAAKRLVTTSHVWGAGSRPLGPSDYHATIRDHLRIWGQDSGWLPEPPKGTTNPAFDAEAPSVWPPTSIGDEQRHRREAAALVRAASAEDPDLDLVAAAHAADWDADIERLLAERRGEAATVIDVAVPRTLSATGVIRLHDDPDQFARDLARPMPRQPAPQARLGTRFHAWVEARFGQESLLDPDELPGRGDLGIDNEADLDVLMKAFESGPFADRVPHAVEAPFNLVLADRVVRGRIDAVYVEPDGGYLLVDWKTGRIDAADPLQLSLYRLAWAALAGVPLTRVRAAFHFVRSGATVEPDLLDEDQVADLLRAATSG